MSKRIVYFNGDFVPESEARVSIYDSALNSGDMAFEVARTIHGRPFRLREHLQRLFGTLAALHTEAGLTLDELERLTLETLDKNQATEAADVDWQIIHNISRGPAPAFRGAFAPEQQRPTVIISCYPLIEKLGRLTWAYDHGLDLVVPPQRALPPELLNPHIKTRCRLHYQLANLQAAAIRPGSTPVLLDVQGFLTEGTSGNLFLVHSGKLFTPTGRNILLGITREVVLELAGKTGIPAEEADLTLEDAQRAEEMFLTSTSIGILHARSFESQAVGNGQRGPVTTRLQHALAEEVGLDFAAQARSYAARL